MTETIEEAVEKMYPICLNLQNSIEYKANIAEKKLAFMFGAKWQTERMYSEEDIKRAYCQGINIDYNIVITTKEGIEMLNIWFEQFKKK